MQCNICLVIRSKENDLEKKDSVDKHFHIREREGSATQREDSTDDKANFLSSCKIDFFFLFLGDSRTND